MKKLIVIIAMFVVGMTTFAQNMKEVVYLKNGSIIKGIIIEQVPNQSLKIQTADGSIFVYNISEVEKITKEAVKPTYSTNLSDEEEEEEDDNKASGNGLKTRFRILMETGYQFGLGDECASFSSAPFNISLGCQIGSHFYVGGGVGIRYLFNEEDGYFALPIFANIRYDILNKRISPFIDVKGGYTPIDISGFFWSGAAGCRFRLGDRFALSASLGVELQDYEAYSWYSTKTETSIGLFTHIGIEF